MQCISCAKETDLIAEKMCYDCYMDSDLRKLHSKNSIFENEGARLASELDDLLKKADEGEELNKTVLAKIKYQVSQLAQGPHKRYLQFAVSGLGVIVLAFAGYVGMRNLNFEDKQIPIQTNITDPLNMEEIEFAEEAAQTPEPVGADPYYDSDGDGIPDIKEITKTKTNPYNADSDGDFLSDYDEIILYGTDPNNPDTDGGGVWDGEEILRGTNPLDPTDD